MAPMDAANPKPGPIPGTELGYQLGNDEATSPVQRLLLQVNGSWIADALYVACELDLPGLLKAAPMDVAALAQRVQADPTALNQLLRALVTLDTVKVVEPDTYALTATGELLTDGHPDSIRHWVIWWSTNLRHAWGHLLDSVKTGQSARKRLENTEGFAHLDRDPVQAGIFNQALVELTRMTAKCVTGAYDFSEYRRVMDVGGGYGELLLSILKANDRLSGVLFDRPHALGGAREHFRQAGCETRCDFVAGDFFEAVPTGADLYMLKSVIHDWDDEQSTRILAHCRDAMGPDGRLLLIERVIPDLLLPTAQHRELVRTDLTMLVALGAGERTAGQFKRLLRDSGFELKRHIPLGTTFSILEAAPVWD